MSSSADWFQRRTLTEQQPRKVKVHSPQPTGQFSDAPLKSEVTPWSQHRRDGTEQAGGSLLPISGQSMTLTLQHKCIRCRLSRRRGRPENSSGGLRGAPLWVLARSLAGDVAAGVTVMCDSSRAPPPPRALPFLGSLPAAVVSPQSPPLPPFLVPAPLPSRVASNAP